MPKGATGSPQTPKAAALVFSGKDGRNGFLLRADEIFQKLCIG